MGTRNTSNGCSGALGGSRKWRGARTRSIWWNGITREGGSEVRPPPRAGPGSHLPRGPRRRPRRPLQLQGGPGAGGRHHAGGGAVALTTWLMGRLQTPSTGWIAIDDVLYAPCRRSYTDLLTYMCAYL